MAILRIGVNKLCQASFLLPLLTTIATVCALLSSNLLANTMVNKQGLNNSQQSLAAAKIPPASIKQMLGQKLMLDLRYYCPSVKPQAKGSCKTAMTTLPAELAQLIRDYDIGGIILFAENLADVEQIVRLNRDLQQAAAESKLKQPLFIAIDQEGGRVARLPRALATSFSGNMAIGATYPQQGTYFASEVGKVFAAELLPLGINVNFAPTVDVNVNPDNPVINVRAFSESPQQVAELGAAMTEAMQQQGMIAALKHFPGHGDTSVDSHFGLPVVKHDAKQIRKVDLYPYKHIFQQHSPGMVMTAHIQFPALDNSTFVAKSGEEMIKPATLSRKILHDVLRQELAYQGVIVTDALDMAGISQFFSQSEAVIQTFAAGADIALMPVKLQQPAELTALGALLDELSQAVSKNVIPQAELTASYQRIIRLKQQYPLLPKANSISEQVQQALKALGSPEHRATELALAQAAISQVKPATANPKLLNKKQNILVIMPDQAKAAALKASLHHYSPTALKIETLSLLQPDISRAAEKIAVADVVISGFISPMQSLAEIGGMDDMANIRNVSAAYQRQKSRFEALLPQITAAKKTHVYISLRAPYDISEYGHTAEWVLATYAYNTAEDPTNMAGGNASYQALAQVLLGQINAVGQLPVTVKPSSL
ncbi:beta-N-acetylhexosaminidase [Rheinheimera sp. MMS21-TC3]|uniref:beta-N-acetylhexosaminidase n=1 Tax=Rheinheimera sp. MMS21-TC3 TaxID=3072790 RepID=UPI0028C4B086|nr:beta-N-acetylhexosaminidase [Rheinheimera sp. MMS21-TC3]WNO60044.1 beta-N-acetylhexosaminidase [Rheinheimera sp. MMS21-TC3]